jgi:hypothetical protein
MGAVVKACARDYIHAINVLYGNYATETGTDTNSPKPPRLAVDLLESLFFRPREPVKDGPSGRRVAAEVLDRLSRSEVLHTRDRRRGPLQRPEPTLAWAIHRLDLPARARNASRRR